MLDLAGVFSTLDAQGLGHWATELEPVLNDRLAEQAHGNLKHWRAALGRLPAAHRQAGEFSAECVSVPDPGLNKAQQAVARDALLELRPWRKGPFAIGDIRIDSEWRSNLKWDRIAHAISSLQDRLVLDVGCGNGYYAFRMLGAGARAVIGIDPTLLYVAQFAAVSHFLEPQPVHVLPLRLADLPETSGKFDSVFSMGVLYHQRSPLDHLRQLRDALRPGGELILETLVLPGDAAFSRTPEARYARMRNVWHLPSLAELDIWLARCGFEGIETVDTTATTTEEQRSTEWMPFESLAEALDPADPSVTVEGWPAPLRAIVLARTPG